MNAQHFLPQSKSDYAAVQRLQELHPNQFAGIANELLEWVQDGNWPIARGIAVLLAQDITTIEQSIISVFKGNDDSWKYWIIYMILGSASPHSFTPSIISELKRIAMHPTSGEREDEVDEAAQTILHKFSLL